MRARLRMVCIGAFSLAATTGCTLKNVNVPPDELMRQVQAGQPMLDCRSRVQRSVGPKPPAGEDIGRHRALAGSRAARRANRVHERPQLLLSRPRRREPRLLASGAALLPHRRTAFSGPHVLSSGRGRIQATLSIPADLCDGYSFPDALYPHLEIVEARLAALSAPTAASDQPRTRRVVRRQVPQASTSRAAPPPGQGATPASAAGSSPAPSSGFVEPAPAAASSATDFFEPPPVRR